MPASEGLTPARRLAPRRPAHVSREIDCGADLGESPFWLAEPQLLMWIDMTRGDLHSADASSACVWHVPRRLLQGRTLAAVAADNCGRLLLVAGRSVLLQCDPSRAERFAVLAEIPDDPPRVQFNDAKVGPDGRLWGGTVRVGTEAGALWAVDSSGHVERQLGGVNHGNGIAWSPAGDQLLFVDSGAGTLTRFGFDRSVGLTGPGRTLLRMPRLDGLPDGLTVDAEGGVWLAVWGGGCVLHLDPDGAAVDRIDLPARNITSCAFVGPDLDRLAVTSAADKEEDSARPGGALYVVDVGVRGIPGYRFNCAAPAMPVQDPTGPPHVPGR